MKDKRGFTMAELLVVVAIIAVLVAIAIPVFSSQLEKSREATDLANVRSAYAEVMNAAILDDTGSELYNKTAGSFQKFVALRQKAQGWSTGSNNLVVGGISQGDGAHWLGEPKENGRCRVQWKNGEATLLWNGWDHINVETAADFLTIDILKGILGEGYKHYVVNSNETYEQGEGTKAFLDYAKQQGFDLADYDAKTWQIYVKDYDGFLQKPAIYWSTEDITKVDDGKHVPIMGYRNGQYDVWYAKVTTYNPGTSNEYKSLDNGTASVKNDGGSATFQFDSYEEAKAKYDILLKAYKQNGEVKYSDLTANKLTIVARLFWTA